MSCLVFILLHYHRRSFNWFKTFSYCSSSSMHICNILGQLFRISWYIGVINDDDLLLWL